MNTSLDRPSAASAGTGWRDEQVAVEGGRALTVRVYDDRSRGAASALVLHFHGGAFVGGSLDASATVPRVFAAAGAAVASVDYPLAPAQPFPSAVEAGYAALVWLDRQRRRLAGATTPIFVAGEEAGGNVAAAVAMVARDRGGPALAGQILLSPMLDACVGTASQRQANNGPVGCPCADGWRAYLAQASDALHPYAVPAQSLRLAGLPPTLLITANDDPLRDEALAYAGRLQAAGVLVQTQVLTLATGWPRSYQRPDGAPWLGVLGALIPAFVRTHTTRGNST